MTYADPGAPRFDPKALPWGCLSSRAQNSSSALAKADSEFLCSSGY